MSNRNLADMFGDSASRTVDDINESERKHFENNNNTSQKQNVNVNDNVNETLTEEQQNVNDSNSEQNVNDNVINNDILASLVAPPKKTVVGIHMEDDINKVLKKLTKNKGKGAQSRLVNDILRKFFEENKLL